MPLSRSIPSSSHQHRCDQELRCLSRVIHTAVIPLRTKLPSATALAPDNDRRKYERENALSVLSLKTSEQRVPIEAASGQRRTGNALLRIIKTFGLGKIHPEFWEGHLAGPLRRHRNSLPVCSCGGDAASRIQGSRSHLSKSPIKSNIMSRTHTHTHALVRGRHQLTLVCRAEG